MMSKTPHHRDTESTETHGERRTEPEAASTLFREVIRRGVAALREDLARLETDVSGFARLEVDAPRQAPRQRQRLDRADPATGGRKALPAPKPQKRHGNYAKASPLRDAIAEILRRAPSALTPSEIAERLRSRAFGYDPGQLADSTLRNRVQTCLHNGRTTIFAHSAHGVGWLLREKPNP